MKTKFEIKSYLGFLLFTFEGESLKEAVVSAIKSGANLSGAYLSGAYLDGANLGGAYLDGANLGGAYLSGAYLDGAYLSGAYLDGAYLSEANLSRANLGGANLSRANLSGANLDGANLDRANLDRANLGGANLGGANLDRANLSRANLGRADLGGANLSGANLSGADLDGAYLSDVKGGTLPLLRTLIVPQVGQFIGWKKCCGDVIVKLMIGKRAKRSNAHGRKCRAEYVKVIEVFGGLVGISIHDKTTRYEAGKIVHCDKWNEDRWTECGGGIHFYLTREEAEAHI